MNISKKFVLSAVAVALASGAFADEFMSEMKSGCRKFNQLRKENAEHLIEKVGEEIRSSFKWNNDNRIIDRNKN